MKWSSYDVAEVARCVQADRHCTRAQPVSDTVNLPSGVSGPYPHSCTRHALLPPTLPAPPAPPTRMPSLPVRSWRCTHRNVTIVPSPCHSKSGQAVINERQSKFISRISSDLGIPSLGLKVQRHRCKQARDRGPWPGYEGPLRIVNDTTREDVRCAGKSMRGDQLNY